MKFGKEACRVTGIPERHAKVFQKVADYWKCVIISRAVGPACTQLIEEGYASKAFHVKAKSCDWGPMAGFLLADPRFTKRKKKDWVKQKKDIEGPMKEGYCTTTPLLLTEERVKYILFDKEARLFRTELTKDNHDYLITRSKKREGNKNMNPLQDVLHVSATSPDHTANRPKVYEFTLIRKRINQREIPHQPLWGVYYGKGSEKLVKQENVTRDKETGLIPVEAIVNARRTYDLARKEAYEDIDKSFGQTDENYVDQLLNIWRKLRGIKIPKNVEEQEKKKKRKYLKELLRKRYDADSGWVKGYRGACTGDYDLFAILPLRADESAGSLEDQSFEIVEEKKQDDEDSGTKKPGGGIRYEHHGIDIRPVKLGITKEEAKLLEGEHPDYGNMTARIYMIRDNLNSGFQNEDGFTDRIMVHHSDEGGRPFWPEIDYPLHAFIPKEKKHYGIENKDELVDVLKLAEDRGHIIVIPPNWQKELLDGFKTNNVTYVIPSWSEKIRKRADLVREHDEKAKGMSGAFSRRPLTAVKSTLDRTYFYTGNRLLDLERTLKRKKLKR